MHRGAQPLERVDPRCRHGVVRCWQQSHLCRAERLAEQPGLPGVRPTHVVPQPDDAGGAA